MKKYLKSLKLMHISLSLLLLVLLVASYFMVYSKLLGIDNSLLSPIFDYLNPLFAFILPSLGILLFNKSVKSMKEGNASLDEKKVIYKAALLKKFSLIDVPVFFAIFVFLLTQNYTHLILGGIVLVFLFIQHPADYRVSEDMGVDPKEFAD